jgi:hypothetical protein
MRLDESQEKQQPKKTEKDSEKVLLKSRRRSLEVTGLGIVASLTVAFWRLASDGTIRISEYLIFVSFLLVSAGAMLWRIFRLAPETPKAAEERLQPGIYRVSFAQQLERAMRRGPRF